jgi:hypothetical protein
MPHLNPFEVDKGHKTGSDGTNEHWQGQIKKQLDMIMVNAMKKISLNNFRNLMTAALGMI